MSKNDVLDGYLNVVEFSGNVYGVEAAAHAYFGTTAAALTVPQAALLAGMVNNPNLYDPYDHPQQAQGPSRRGHRRDGPVGVHHARPGRRGDGGTAGRAARRARSCPAAPAWPPRRTPVSSASTPWTTSIRPA